MSNPANRCVVLLSTGGTIASQPDLGGSLTASQEGQDLLDRVVLPAGTQVVVHDVSTVLGTALGIDDLLSISRQAHDQDGQVTAVVVTAGTGIIEEGSFLCSLFGPPSHPIIWTGAQYAVGPHGDGPGNLTDAIRLGLDPGARVLGTVVVFDRRIFSAREAIKSDAVGHAAFSAPNGGPLGEMSDEGVVFYERGGSGPHIPLGELEKRVDLIKLAAGSGSLYFDASITAGARGIIVEGFPGVGMASPSALPGIQRALDAGLVVVLCSRSAAGHVQPRYGTQFGARKLESQGVILGGRLPSTHARLLLMALLPLQLSHDELARRFGRFAGDPRRN